MSNAKAGTHRRLTGPALEAMYRFLLWLMPTTEKFRTQKSSRGGTHPVDGAHAWSGLIVATYTRARANVGAAAPAPNDTCSHHAARRRDEHHFRVLG